MILTANKGLQRFYPPLIEIFKENVQFQLDLRPPSCLLACLFTFRVCEVIPEACGLQPISL